mmetsp:Transcript_34895/g.96307  ORF Transcript_34895/g.96307 Transcript_34895/m.96307 type:complete len:230 (+) Transcript_34895:782-1471(+)
MSCEPLRENSVNALLPFMLLVSPGPRGQRCNEFSGPSKFAKRESGIRSGCASKKDCPVDMAEDVTEKDCPVVMGIMEVVGRDGFDHVSEPPLNLPMVSAPPLNLLVVAADALRTICFARCAALGLARPVALEGPIICHSCKRTSPKRAGSGRTKTSLSGRSASCSSTFSRARPTASAVPLSATMTSPGLTQFLSADNPRTTPATTGYAMDQSSTKPIFFSPRWNSATTK